MSIRREELRRQLDNVVGRVALPRYKPPEKPREPEPFPLRALRNAGLGQAPVIEHDV
jgi:hypothetical protein